MRVRKMKRGKTGVSQNVKGEKEKASERVGSEGSEALVALKLVRSQRRALGMKTGRAVCLSQA